MKSNSLLRTAALLAVAALALPVFAKPISETINITQAARVGKADLQAGEYRLLIDGNKATVQKGKSVIAESEGRGKSVIPSPTTTPYWSEKMAKSRKCVSRAKSAFSSLANSA